ncbi:MAG: aminotransferase class V-fold PLP-dependent enzyme [Lachnospiraceae bacterium]|nr:aminotransferase class V-fold PLP-dependent enzyme [Lachnospiraceae bacterium]
MPGHKRNIDLMGTALPYEIDITELEEFDDLHHASGIILAAQKRAARLYHAEETHFLVNGSTAGNLSAVMACTHLGDKILVARNCHKSIYNAIYLQEIQPIYIYPKFNKELQLNGEVTSQEVAKALRENPDIRAVVIVSPTYDGVISDVTAIAEIAHQYKIPLIVDEAHGAHFGFDDYFAHNANDKGADLVIHSIHKTLPALTQTALLHINGTIVDKKRVRFYLQMFQSSSPSYVLMASIDATMDLLENRRVEVFEVYVKQLKNCRKKLQKLEHLRLIETEHYDRSKIIISVSHTNITSKELYDRLLREYHLQMEMAAGTYIVAMTSIGDTNKGFERLITALTEIDLELENKENKAQISGELPKLEIVYTSAQMSRISDELVQDYSGEYIATQYKYLYPPGIPIVVPGEKVTPEVMTLLRAYEKAGFAIEEC